MSAWSKQYMKASLVKEAAMLCNKEPGADGSNPTLQAWLWDNGEGTQPVAHVDDGRRSGPGGATGELLFYPNWIQGWKMMQHFISHTDDVQRILC